MPLWVQSSRAPFHIVCPVGTEIYKTLRTLKVQAIYTCSSTRLVLQNKRGHQLTCLEKVCSSEKTSSSSSRNDLDSPSSSSGSLTTTGVGVLLGKIESDLITGNSPGSTGPAGVFGARAADADSGVVPGSTPAKPKRAAADTAAAEACASVTLPSESPLFLSPGSSTGEGSAGGKDGRGKRHRVME